MSKQKKYFGTDGIRNHVGQGLISPDQVLKLGWATGKVIRNHGEHSVMIGKDTRISGYMFESALEAGFIAAGINVYLLGPMPTPAIAYLTQTFSADAGVVISASHNPHHDNGIKFFSSEGKKISDDIEHEVEAMFEAPIDIVSSEELGKAARIDDAAGRYIEFCKSTFSAKQKLEGLKIVLDCANGATYHVAPAVFRELGADIVVIGDQPDGININQGCGATDLKALQQKVIAESADFGIAFDGDGDRVMMVDHQGQVVDGDQILYILACHSGNSMEGVVGTKMSNLGLENAIKAKGMTFIRADVGDRYVMQELVSRGWLFGAEQSGHVLCLDKTTTGDGIVAALQVVSIMVNADSSLKSLVSDLKLYPQQLVNVKVSSKQAVLNDADVITAVEQAERAMVGKGRVLIRPSGTEPVVRIMIEAESESLIKTHMKGLESLIRTKFS